MLLHSKGKLKMKGGVVNCNILIPTCNKPHKCLQTRMAIEVCTYVCVRLCK